MPGKYKGISKAEVRALVLATNKNRPASDKKRLDMNNEIKSWRIQNKNTTTNKTSKSSTEKPTVEKKEFSNYGQGGAENKRLLRDETYSDYAREIRGEAPEEDLYKTSSLPKKRGYIMKRNRK